MYNKYLLKDLFTLRKEKVPAGEFLIINGDDFYSNSPYFLKNYRYGNFPNAKLKKTGYNGFFKKGDILLLTIGAKKKVWLAGQSGVCASGNNKIKIITAKHGIVFAEYLIALLISNNMTNWLKATLAGSVIPQVLWLPFIQKEVFIPSLEEQKKVISHLANLRKYCAKIEQLSLSLSLDN